MPFPIAALGAFFGGNWKTLMLYGAIAFVALFGYGKVKDYFTSVRNTTERLHLERVERVKAEVERDTAQQVLDQERGHYQTLMRIQAEHSIALDRIRTEAQNQHEVFEEHDFEALTDAKPGLIERLANKASQERMDEFEAAFND